MPFSLTHKTIYIDIAVSVSSLSFRISPARSNDSSTSSSSSAGGGGAGTGAAAKCQPYGTTFDIGDKICCGWSPQQGVLWFAVGDHMQGRAPIPLYGPPGFYFPIIGVQGASKLTIKARFALGFATPRALGLDKESGYAPGAVFKFDSLYYH